MKNKILAICDQDEKYLQSLQTYVLKHALLDFTLLTFANLAQASIQNQSQEFDILLVAESTLTEDITKLKAKTILILQETDEYQTQQYSHIHKFQSVQQLFAQVLEEYTKQVNTQIQQKSGGKKQTRLITFYSPSRSSQQTIAALAAAQLLLMQQNQEKKKICFLTVETQTGLERLLQTSFERDLADLMYFAGVPNQQLLYKLTTIRKTLHGLEYIPPAKHQQDLMQITAQEWQCAIEQLISLGEYDVLILELNALCQGAEALLARSDKIITLYEDHQIAEAIMAEYQQNKCQDNTILQKTCFRAIPYACLEQSYDYERLHTSALGRQMRACLEEYLDE